MRIAINTRLLIKNKLDGIGRFSIEILKRIIYQSIPRKISKKGIEKYGAIKSFVSIGLGCDMQYAKELIYAE